MGDARQLLLDVANDYRNSIEGGRWEEVTNALKHRIWMEDEALANVPAEVLEKLDELFDTLGEFVTRRDADLAFSTIERIRVYVHNVEA